jgi:hypothetical protein
MISYEIAQRRICLMPNGRDHRNWESCNGASEILIIECPEIFPAPTASADDHNLSRSPAEHTVESESNLLRRSVTLNLARREHNVSAGASPLYYGNHIVQSRTLRTRYHCHRARSNWQRALPCRIQQSL